jgi:endonuclease/exonuclease/phosphatase (EEP) superfamily protein YafD
MVSPTTMTNDKLLKISYILGSLMILATVLPLSTNQYWFIRIFDFPRVQIFFLLLLSALLFYLSAVKFTITRKVFLGALLISAGFHVYTIIPYTPFYPHQSLYSEKTNNAENEISLIYFNVEMDNREKDKALKELLKYKPDIILTAETDHWWKEALQPLEKEYKYTALLPLENTYGMMLYSNLPLENADFEFLVEKDVPSINPIVTLPSGQRIQCFFIHPKPPVPKEDTDSKDRDAELIVVAKRAAKSDLHVIVAGDLNDVGWSRTSRLFQRISKLLDPRVGRGLYATFNAKYPLIRWPLDHIFHSKEFRLISLEKLEHVGSDHFPIYIKLSYEPENGKEQKPLPSDKEDQKDASKKIRKSEISLNGIFR